MSKGPMKNDYIDIDRVLQNNELDHSFDFRLKRKQWF